MTALEITPSASVHKGEMSTGSAETWIAPVAVADIENEPRVLDLDLGERLGLARPRKIREMIKANLAELQQFGVCPSRGQTSGPKGGRPKIEYWLNEEQALLVSVLSNAPKAPAVRKMLIETFVAYRRGHLVDDRQLPSDLTEQVRRIDGISRMLSGKVTGIEKLVERLEPFALAMSGRDHALAENYAVSEGIVAGEALDMAGVKDRKGLRGLAKFVSGRLQKWHIDKGVAIKRGRLGRNTALLFNPPLVREWLAAGGKVEIENYVKERLGQGKLRLLHGGAA